MQELSRRTSFSGPALIRILARFNDADIPEPEQSLSDCLSQWLAWSDAISLAAVLKGAVPTGAGASGLDPAGEYERVRTALREAIAGVHAPAVAAQRRRRPAVAKGDAAIAAPVEFSDYRQRYIALQQTMETRIAELRARLRIALTCETRMAGLAGLDAAMEQALGEREYRLLAGLPSMLELHFHRLRRAEAQSPADAPETARPALSAVGTWRDVFDRDMQSVLFAELDIRLQPVQGLLAALRAG